MTEAYLVIFILSIIALVFALIVKRDKPARKDPEYRPTTDQPKIG